jgi:hypothetical protein
MKNLLNRIERVKAALRRFTLALYGPLEGL